MQHESVPHHHMTDFPEPWDTKQCFWCKACLSGKGDAEVTVYRSDPEELEVHYACFDCGLEVEHQRVTGAGDAPLPFFNLMTDRSPYPHYPYTDEEWGIIERQADEATAPATKPAIRPAI